MTHIYDVICVGSGLVGRFLTIGLAQRGLKVASIDQIAYDPLAAANNDGRTTSISLGSKILFEQLGLWNTIAPFAQPIDHIRVLEDGSPWTLDYDANDLSPDPMGYIVENRYIQNALHDPAIAHPLVENAHLTVVAPTHIQSIDWGDPLVTVNLSTGQTLTAPLVIAIDGHASKLRQQSTIESKTKDYNQKALVCHIAHEKPHNNTAFEVFRKDGPLAVLPMTPLNDSNRSGIVWCQPRGFDFNALTDDELVAAFMKQFPYFGAAHIISKRWVFPLSYRKVSSLVDHRLALAGDAGHVMHPIAGQGVNLGWRDAATLIKILGDAKRQGIDLGCPFLLKRYDKERTKDRLGLLWITDSINNLYQNQFPPLRFARNAAFAILNNIKPIKRAFMRYAMGLF